MQKFSFTNIEFSKNWTKMQFSNQCPTRSLDLKVPLNRFYFNFFQIFLLKIQLGIFDFALQKISFTNIEFSKNWTKMQFSNQCPTRSLDLKVPLKPFLLQFFSNFFA